MACELALDVKEHIDALRKTLTLLWYQLCNCSVLAWMCPVTYVPSRCSVPWLAVCWGYSACIEDRSTQFIDPPTLCLSLSLSPSSQRTLVGICPVLPATVAKRNHCLVSLKLRKNQWDPLFPLQHVGRGAPARADVSWLRPAERRLRRLYLCVSVLCF